MIDFNDVVKEDIKNIIEIGSKFMIIHEDY